LSLNEEILCHLELQWDLKSHKKYNPSASSNNFFNLYALETSKFKQSVLTLVSPVSSIDIRDNNI